MPRNLRPLALALLALTVLAVDASARPAVRVSPAGGGDVNSVFAFHGTGWRPGATVGWMRGILCGDPVCVVPAFGGEVPTDRAGRWVLRYRPDFTPDDYAGFVGGICFSERRTRRCTQISVAPPAAAVSPATAYREGSEPTELHLRVSHFRAGRALRATVTGPRGFRRTLGLRALLHRARRAGIGLDRGEQLVTLKLSPSARLGGYSVVVEERRDHAEARAAFRLARP